MSREVYVDHFSYALGEELATVEEAAARRRTLTDAPALRMPAFGSTRSAKRGRVLMTR